MVLRGGVLRPHGVRETVALGVALVLTGIAVIVSCTPSDPGAPRSTPVSTPSDPSARSEAASPPGTDQTSGANDTGTSTPTPTTGDTLDYVALGDSFTAAPYNPVSIPAGGCMRSTGNYPRLLAQQLGDVTLVDASCGGATTDHLEGSQRVDGVDLPPQLDSVTAETDLVTVSLGLNDFGLYGRLLYRCAALGAQGGDDAAPCEEATDRAELDRQLALIGDRVATGLGAVQDRAPRATVVLVGYPQIVDADRQCPDRLPLASGDVDLVASALGEISRQVLLGARRAQVASVDLQSPGAAHDICADQPWVNGTQDDFNLASAYHPFPVEQQAVADLIAPLVESRR